MKRRTKIRIASFAVALILLLGGFVYTGYAKAGFYRWMLEASFQQNFSALTESMNQISTTLHKGRYATSPTMVVSLSNEVMRQSALASAALSGLPFSHIELDKTSKFLTQVGDYAYAIARKEASGKPLSAEEKKNIVSLSDTAYQLSSNLNDLYNNIFSKKYVIGDMMLSNSPDKAIGGIAKSITEIETQFPDYAGLIYDGPFSEHIEKMQPIMLMNQREVSRQDAAKHVADSFKLDPASVRFEGESAGTIPVYSFSAPYDGGTLNAAVTKTGGFIINMMNSRVVTQTKLSVDDSINRAIDFMKSLGVTDMAKNYYVVKNNIVTVNFAYTSNNITYYPDLMKVSVAMDNGSITGFESRGYIMSHGKRTLPAIKVSEADVRKNVADGLKIESVRLAVIPSMGKYELFCYELKAVDNSGQRYLIYRNVETGIEEQILILVEDGNGVLSI